MKKNIDKKQNALIEQLRQKVRSLEISRKKNKKPAPKKRVGKPFSGKRGKRASPSHSGYLRSDHSNPVIGILDSVPTTACLHRGQSSVNIGNGQSFMYLGFLNGGKDQTLEKTAGGTVTMSNVAGVSYSWNTFGTDQFWNPTAVNNPNVKSSMQKAVSPYGLTSSTKCKLNKASLHISYAGTQTMMSAMLHIFIDYHGDVVKNLRRNTSTAVNGYALGATYDLIFNHPRTIKVKVDSGSAIDYALPFPTAQLYSAQEVNPSDFNISSDPQNLFKADQVLFGAIPNLNSQMDNVSVIEPFFYQQESTTATPSTVFGYSYNNPLVYVVGSFPTAALLSVNLTMDWEYHDEDLYSVSKPSLCDSLTATALHTLVMNGHHEATTKPVHKGLKFKDIIRNAAKAEHTASALATSPLGEAVLAAALA